MDKDIIDKKLKAEINFFNIYAVFIVGLVTGNYTIYLDYLLNKSELFLNLFYIGIFSLIVTFTFSIKTTNNENNLYYSVNNSF